MDVVIGAFGFTGKYLTRRLVGLERKIITLTGRPGREHPLGPAVTALPFNFDDFSALAASLTGASTLYNTYWIRFERGEVTFDRTLAHTRVLLQAAKEAGVRRVVHFSAVHADESSPYPYFRAKGQAERLLRESGLSHAILRPTVLFGKESIFFNNITWMLRHYPVFAIPGRHGGRLQPIFVEDVAEMAIQAAGSSANLMMEAAGPEIFTFEELIRLILRRIHRHTRLLHLRPERTLQLSRIIGDRMGDVVLTKDEIDGLLNDLLVADSEPTGHTRFSDWLNSHAQDLGRTYFSEIERHFR